MARRNNNIEVMVKGEADFGRARRDAARNLDAIEKDAKNAADDIERAFDRIELSPELDTADIRQALDLADQLDGMVAKFTVDTDLEEIQQAEKIARSLRAFQGRVDLSVEGRAELQDALGLADKLDDIRTVKVQVQGQKDLQRAADLADNIGDDLAQAGERGADGIADAIGGIDFDGIGRQGLDSLTGALSAVGPWGAAAGAIALVFGDELIDGFTAGFNRRRRDIMRALTSGLDERELAASGERAGDAWARGFGESRQELQANADELTRILDNVATSAELGPVTEQAQVLADVFGVDVRTSALLAGRAIKQGLADDVEDAFDDMIGAAQEFGQTGIEALDVYQEFGANFARFGVDGGQAIRFIAESFEDGLFPTIDRAGELFEEFTTRVTDGDAQEAIEELGLDFARIQADIAKGGVDANRAFQDVIVALQGYGTEADRNRLKNVLFASSMEQVSDLAEVLNGLLELLRDNTDAYAGAGEDAADALASQVTEFDKLQRSVGDLSKAMGEELAEGVNNQIKRWQLYRFAVEQVWNVIEDVVDPLHDVAKATGRADAELKNAARSTGEFGDAAAATAGEVGDLEDEVGWLEDALDDLFDFGADRLMRDIEEAAADLADAVEDVDASIVGMNGEIDVSTEAGRRFQSRLEQVSGVLQDVELAYGRNEISAGTYQSAQERLRGEFRRIIGTMGLSATQAQKLFEKYTAIAGIGPIRTSFAVDIPTDEWVELQRFEQILRNMPRSVSVGVNRPSGGGSAPRRTTTTSRSTSRILRRAEGGPATGLTLVGEEGPELLDLGSQRGFVHDAPDTRRIINAAASSFGASGARSTTRPTPVVIEIRSGGSAFDDALVEVLRKSIANRGGNVQQVLG